MRTSLALNLMLLGVLAAPSLAQTRTTSSTRAPSVRVTPGGDPVSVTVSHADVKDFSEFRVVRNGSPVRFLTVTVPRTQRTQLTRMQRTSSGTTQITVRIAASETAPAGTYQLEALAGRRTVGPLASVTVEAPAALVDGATPSSLALTAAGPSRTVQLTGNGLESFTGAFVERSGTRINTVRADLLPASGGQTRELRLSALSNAGPPWEVPLRVVLESGPAGLVPVEALALSVEEPAVDLLVGACGDIEVTPNVLSASIPIENRGSDGATFLSNQVIARTTGFGSFPRTVRSPAGGLYIPAGGVHVVEVVIQEVVEPGEHALTWAVDPDDVVLESNGMNNGKWCPFSVTETDVTPRSPNRSELVISDISVEPYGGPPGTERIIRVEVQNTSAVPNEMRTVRCEINGVRLFDARFGKPPIGYMQTDVMEHSMDGDMAPGMKTLECEVDYLNAIPELNEDNNTHTVLFVVSNPNL